MVEINEEYWALLILQRPPYGLQCTATIFYLSAHQCDQTWRSTCYHSINFRNGESFNRRSKMVKHEPDPLISDRPQNSALSFHISRFRTVFYMLAAPNLDALLFWLTVRSISLRLWVPSGNSGHVPVQRRWEIDQPVKRTDLTSPSSGFMRCSPY